MNKIFSARMFLLDLRRQLKSIFVWVIVSLVLVFFAGFMFSSIETSGMPELLNDMMTSLPEELLNSVNLNILPDFSNHAAVFGIMSQWLLVIACIYACYIGAASLVRFSCDGSVNFLYAQPISRTALVITRYISHFASIIIYNIFLFFIMWVYANIIELQSPAEMALMVVSVFVLTEFLFYSVGFIASVFLRSLSSAASFGFGMFIFTYAAACFGRFMPKLDAVVYVCPYEYFSVYSLCVGGYTFPTITAILAVVFALFLFVCGAMIFVQKDIKDY